MTKLSLDAMSTVTGGQGAPTPLKAPLLPAPFKPAGLLPKPDPYHGQAPPKYSAGWWDIVRARGLFK